MSEPNNPYAPPVARVDDLPDFTPDGALIRLGRTVPAGNGAKWLGTAWQIFKQNPGSWILLLLLYFVIGGALSFIPIVNLVVFLVGPVFTGGIVYACDQQRKTGKVNIGHLFTGFRQQTTPLLLLGAISLSFMALCYIVIAVTVDDRVASALVLGDSAAMVSAGEISSLVRGMMIYFGFLFLIGGVMWCAPTLVMLHGIPAIESLKISITSAIRNFLPGLVSSLLFFILLIVGAIPIFLGYFVVFPMLFISIYTAYRDIFIEEV